MEADFLKETPNICRIDLISNLMSHLCSVRETKRSHQVYQVSQWAFEYLAIILADWRTVFWTESVWREIFDFQMQWGKLSNDRSEVIEEMNRLWLHGLVFIYFLLLLPSFCHCCWSPSGSPLFKLFFKKKKLIGTSVSTNKKLGSQSCSVYWVLCFVQCM